METKKISVLRLGHRRIRDQRLSTHIGLTAALFNLETVYYSGDHDQSLEESIRSVAEKWGSATRISHTETPFKIIKEFQGTTIHLTMYGAPHFEVIPQVKNENQKSILIIVGGAKVPAHVYKMVDYNCAVGYFPHSEVSALALTLYELVGKNPIYTKDPGAPMKLRGGEKGWGKKQQKVGEKKEGEKTF